MVVTEAVYGWYPPAKSRWTKPTKPGLPIGYEAECLYRHWNSRYNADKRGVETPETPSVVCIDLNTPPHPPKQISSRPQSSSSKASARTSSVKVPKFSTPPVAFQLPVPKPPAETTKRGHHGHGAEAPPGRPKRAWAMHTEATPIVSPSAAVPHPPTSPKIYSPVPLGKARPVLQASPTAKDEVGVNAARAFAGSPGGSTTPIVVEKKPRIQSAPPQRPTPTGKQARPVKSAGPVRSDPPDVASKFRDLPQPGPSVKTPTPAATQAITPKPCSAFQPKSPTAADCKKVLDYDTELKKHGWRMEIPGDPLGLKAPCIAPRLSCTKKIPIPAVAPNPPTGHMQVFDTYFYNTIPRKPLSFTVHPEWVSEVLHAKRLAWQKKEGMKYKHTNYSFAY